MSATVNTHQLCSVTLLGNLVAVPEIRYLANPVLAVTELTLATTHRWQDKRTQANKEWTSYHSVKVIGHLVERSLNQVKKGEILLLQGYLANQKQTNHGFVHATALEVFPKGFTHSINQLTCSATLISPVNLVTTENNVSLASATIRIHHQAFAEHKQAMQSHMIERTLNIWGKQGVHFAEQAKLDDSLIIEGRLAYSGNQAKHQTIEANQVHLIKQPT